MMSHGVSWCLMMSHVVSWCLMVSHGVSWCLMMSHDVSWCLMLSHDVSWCLMVSHGVSCCLMVYHCVLLCLMVSHGVTWSHNVVFFYTIQLYHRLKPGEALTYNNRQFLHSRTAFELNGGMRYFQVGSITIPPTLTSLVKTMFSLSHNNKYWYSLSSPCLKQFRLRHIYDLCTPH